MDNPEDRYRIGRPTDRPITPEIIELTLKYLREGLTLAQIAECVDVSRGALIDRIAKNPELKHKAYIARLEGVSALMEDTIRIADEDGDPELRIRVRQWYVNKLLPYVPKNKEEGQSDFSRLLSHLDQKSKMLPKDIGKVNGTSTGLVLEHAPNGQT